MEIKEYLNEEEWKNITPYICPLMCNMGDGVEYQIQLSLYTEIERKGESKDFLCGGKPIATITGNGIELTKNHPEYHLKLLRITKPEAHDFYVCKNGFMILAKKRKKVD